MKPDISAYVPCFNNRATVVDAVRSLQAQTLKPGQLFVVDDGSTDGSPDLLEAQGYRVVRLGQNSGRGAARDRAMSEARHEFVLCCDATNELPPYFAEQALQWFDDASVAAVFGLITDPAPDGAVRRWRARHLFKAGSRHEVGHYATLITVGAMVRASSVAAVGGYNVLLRHNEDNDLSERLICGGYDVVGDPALKVLANARNTLPQVLERYWRWHIGKEERFSLAAYLRSVWYATRVMAVSDLKAGDPAGACISLLSPHYQLWRHIRK